MRVGRQNEGKEGEGKKVRNSMQVGLHVSLVAYLFFVHACKCEYACMFVCMFVCVCLFVCVCVCLCTSKSYLVGVGLNNTIMHNGGS